MPEVQKLVEMPRGYDVGYVMLMGVPAVKYRKVIKKEENVTNIII